jgi:hypothetical protein
MWGCVPGVLFVAWICLVRVIALDSVKISKFQFVSHVSQKLFNLQPWNFTGMLINIHVYSYAQEVSVVDLFRICRVVALELVKICSSTCVVYISKRICPKGMKLPIFLTWILFLKSP